MAPTSFDPRSGSQRHLSTLTLEHRLIQASGASSLNGRQKTHAEYSELIGRIPRRPAERDQNSGRPEKPSPLLWCFDGLAAEPAAGTQHIHTGSRPHRAAVLGFKQQHQLRPGRGMDGAALFAEAFAARLAFLRHKWRRRSNSPRARHLCRKGILMFLRQQILVAPR